jgi:hypothetical protein
MLPSGTDAVTDIDPLVNSPSTTASTSPPWKAVSAAS